MTELRLEIGNSRLRDLYEYWLQKRGRRIAPSRSDIASRDISDTLPWVLLVEIVGERFRYRLAGSSITQEYGGELTGKYLDEVDLDHVTAYAIDEYRKSAQDIVPVVSQWEYRKNSGRYLKYERLILPLSSDGHAVDMFLCAAIGFGFD